MAERRVTVTPGRGKLRGRSCVKVFLGDGDKVRTSKSGRRLARVQFHGCFTHAGDARAAAHRLQQKRSL